MKEKAITLPDPIDMGKESVKVSKDLLTQIKERKKATGITITAFVEQAITDKLSKTK